MTIPASPDPAAALTATACRATDLRTKSQLEGAGGMSVNFIRITVKGTTPCRLEGYPKLVPLNDGHPVDIPVKRLTDRASYRRPVLVAKHQPAELPLTWEGNWCAPPVKNDAIRAVLPHGGGNLRLPGFGSTPFCGSGLNTGPVPITFRSFQPQSSRVQTVRSIYRTVSTEGDFEKTVAPKKSFRFVVTLVSTKPIRLDPCPDYSISQYAAEPGLTHLGDRVDVLATGRVRRTVAEHEFALNCAAVPYTDADGTPYLPARTPVRFAMQLTAGSSGTEKIVWELAGAPRVAVGGELTVK